MTTIAPVHDIHQPELALALQHALDNKTKPVGSLGRLEALAQRIGLIQGTLRPELREPQMLVCAADHGLAARGVSAFPSDVTWQMVENFLAGGAAVSVLARQHGMGLTVVDCGVRHEFAPRAGLLVRKVAPGTADALEGPAMSAAQCAQALANGREVLRSCWHALRRRDGIATRRLRVAGGLAGPGLDWRCHRRGHRLGRRGGAAQDGHPA